MMEVDEWYDAVMRFVYHIKENQSEIVFLYESRFTRDEFVAAEEVIKYHCGASFPVQYVEGK